MVLLPCLLVACFHTCLPLSPRAGLPSWALLSRLAVVRAWSDTTITPPTLHQQIIPWSSSPQPAEKRAERSRRRLGTALRRRHSLIPSQNICALAKTVVLWVPLQRVRDFLGKESMAQIQPHSYICASLYAQQHVCNLKGLKLIMCKTVCVWEDLDCHDGKN